MPYSAFRTLSLIVHMSLSKDGGENACLDCSVSEFDGDFGVPEGIYECVSTFSPVWDRASDHLETCRFQINRYSEVRVHREYGKSPGGVGMVAVGNYANDVQICS